MSGRVQGSHSVLPLRPDLLLSANGGEIRPARQGSRQERAQQERDLPPPGHRPDLRAPIPDPS